MGAVVDVAAGVLRPPQLTIEAVVLGVERLARAVLLRLFGPRGVDRAAFCALHLLQSRLVWYQSQLFAVVCGTTL